jgi:hypothetical protein
MISLRRATRTAGVNVNRNGFLVDGLQEGVKQLPSVLQFVVSNK